MTASKISTQKLHASLRASGFVSQKYKPSDGVDRSGYRIHNVRKGYYSLLIWRCKDDNAEYDLLKMQKALLSSGIVSEIQTNFNNGESWIDVRKFQ